MTKSCLKSKQNRRIITQSFRIQFACLLQTPASIAEYLFIIRQVVTTQFRQRSTLSHSDTFRILCRRKIDIPNLPGSIGTAGSSCWLLEMEDTGNNIYCIHRNTIKQRPPIKKAFFTYGNLGYCLKSGLRFSRNAFLPSCASSVR